MKISYLCIFIIALSCQSLAAKNLSDALLECATVDNSLRRLVCYDRLSSEVQLFEDVPVPSDIVNSRKRYSAPKSQSEQPHIERDSKDDFGLTGQQTQRKSEDFGLPPRKELKETDKKKYYNVAKVSINNRKLMVITMTNGQVWKQKELERYKIKEGDVVYIERGALGSFWLSKDDVRKRIRIKRIK